MLSAPTPTNNTLLKWHWQKLREYKRNVATEIAAQLGRDRPFKPFARAEVVIVRYSTNDEPDPDNLYGGLKGLLDCLVPTGEPRRIGRKMVLLHPFGLGLIADDKPAVMRLVVQHQRVNRRASQRTAVTITEML